MAKKSVDTPMQVLLFQMGPETFAIAADKITEVVRKPSVTRVPYAPAGLIGIANLRGVAIPVISIPGVAVNNGDQKLIVVNDGRTVGIAVDNVLQLRAADTSETARLLDLNQLISSAAGSTIRPAKALNVFGDSSAAAIPAPPTVSMRAVLCFKVVGQTYGLPLEDVREVFSVPIEMSPVPGADAGIVGLVRLRDRVLPLVSVAALLGLIDTRSDKTGDRVVVIEFDKQLVGVTVEAMDAIRRLSASAIDPVPSILNRGGGQAEIDAIGRINDGQELVSILSTQKLFGSDIMSRIHPADLSGVPATPQVNSPESTEQLLIFELGDETYGIPVGAVDEVARVPDVVTRLPNSPGFVSGIMNLRGKAVPLIDQSKRFGVSDEPEKKNRRAVVLTIGDLQAGFIVDRVTDIATVASSFVSAAPDFGTPEAEVFDRVIHLEADGRMILLIDAAELLTRAERDLISELSSTLSKGQRL